MTANQLTNACLAFLRKNGYEVWRQNNMGVFETGRALQKMIPVISAEISIGLLARSQGKNFFSSENEKKGKTGGFSWGRLSAGLKRCMAKSWRPSPGSKKGISDIIGYHLETGKWIGVEIKAGKDTLKPDQRKFLLGLNTATAEGYVARDYDKFTKEWQARQEIKAEEERKKAYKNKF